MRAVWRWLVGALIVTLAIALIAAVWASGYWPKVTGLSLPKAATPRDAAIPATANRAAFDRWLAADTERPATFRAFERFIADNGYGDLLPAWTLLRTNSNKSGACRAAPFILPPRRVWPNILPALKLVREQAIPAVGRVEVASAFRVPGLNACSKGARASRHLTFAALDLIPLDQPDAAASFARLCAQWRKAGTQSRWGLGAYYDPARPHENQVARFHVDGTGWRTWGFSFGRASSGCNSL